MNRAACDILHELQQLPPPGELSLVEVTADQLRFCKLLLDYAEAAREEKIKRPFDPREQAKLNLQWQIMQMQLDARQ
jgi:hypothetical protein